MKETIKINLSGLLFDLDNDAYDKLKNYLDSIKQKFASSESEAEEIIEDIESRIAEILQEKISGTKQVISLSDIEEIIALMGTADEMGDADEDEVAGGSANSSKQSGRNNKRFYRDPQNSILGGVSSGIAAYFNIDPLWIRLLFVFLFFANLAGLFIYIILWFVLPPAITTAQRMEMQGKQVFTLNDIEGSVRSEYEKVKTSVKNIPRSEGYKNAESALSEIFSVIGRILLVFVKIIGAIIVVSLLIAFVSTVIGLVIGGAAFMPWQFFHDWHFPHMFHWTNISLFGICLFLVLVLPIIALITKIIRLLFNIPSNNRVAAGIGATIWVIAFISLIVLLGVESDRGLFRSTEMVTKTIEVDEEKPLYVSLKKHRYDRDDFENYQVFNFKFAYDKYDDDFYKRPELVVEESETDKVKLRIEYSYANFKVGRVPNNMHQVVDYYWHVNDTALILDEYYVCDDDEAWRVPFVTLKLEIPEGRKVYFDDDLQKLFNEEDYSGQKYKMVDGKLETIGI